MRLQTPEAGVIRGQRRGSCLVLMLDHPPANAISEAVIARLGTTIDAASDDPTIESLLLMGAGHSFSAGMDPACFGTVAAARALDSLNRRIETLDKPVTAALTGMCLGAGLELALACHWRIATPDARMGFPEIHLGLVPGSGGSQRLPRLIDGAEALRILLDGLPVDAAEALALGLVDQVAEEDFHTAALAFATSRPGPRPTCDRPGQAGALFGQNGALARARARVSAQRLAAPGQVVHCVEAAALLPFEAGLAMEAVAFADLAAGDEAQGLRAAWVTERRAAQLPAAVQVVLQGAGLPRIAILGLWAPGPQAAPQIVRHLGSGLKVVLAASDRDSLVAVLNRVAELHEALVAEGKLDAVARDADWARLTPAIGADSLASADLVLADDTVPAGVAAGRRILSGGLPGDRSGVALTLPDTPGGPAEIAMSADADPQLAARALALVRRLGDRSVFTGPGGPVLARLRRALVQAMVALEREGTPAERMAGVLDGFGMNAAPLPEAPAGGLAAEPAEEARILRACLSALAAEGGRLLDEGVARRPLDIDAIALLSGLFPRWEGGPMAWADRLGLLVLRVDLWGRAGSDPALYAVPALFDRLISEGRPLASLNGRRLA